MSRGGEMLVAWTEVTSGAPEWEEQKVCGSAVTRVAVGSPQAGFEDLGAVSGPVGMSIPTGVAIDEAGAGWVIGTHNAPTWATRYGLEWEWTSAWVAFRPPSTHFQPAFKLPSKGIVTELPKVAEDAAGVTLFAWDTERGAYLAWGEPNGTVTRPRFFAHHLRVSEIGVNDQGDALVIGYYGLPRSETATSIVAITAPAYGMFSRPHLIAAEPRAARGRVRTEFKAPFAAVGPTGAAVIIWETWREIPKAAEGPSLLVYREADGRYTRRRSIAKEFLNLRSIPAQATIDAAGGALILRPTDHGWREVTVMPGGRLGRERQVPEGNIDPVLAGNEHGETVIAVGQSHSILALSGNTLGALPTSLTIPAPDENSPAPVVAIDGHGHATAIWMESPGHGVTLVKVSTIASSAQSLQIARGELKP